MIQEGRTSRPLAGLLAAEVVSTTGSEITAIALPWFVLVTTGSPARMGAVMAADFAGTAILGIPSGRAATSLGPRRTMLASDLARAPLIAVIPLLHWAGALTFPVLIMVAFAVGAFFPAYSASQRLVLTGLVGEDEIRLTRASGMLGSVNETASFVGPALGGLLVALLGPAAALMIDAGSYVAAFVLVAVFVPPVETPSEDGPRGALDGLRQVRRDRPLRWRVAGLAIVEIGWTAMIATLPVLARRRFHSTARLAGWLVASFGAGSVAGGLVSSRAKRTSEGVMRLAIAGLAVSTWPLLAPLPAWGIALAVAANGFCAGLYYTRFFAAVTVRTPAALRARVMTSVETVISATGPLGFLGAGLLLQRVASPTVGFVLVVAAATFGAALVLNGRTSPAPRSDG